MGGSEISVSLPSFFIFLSCRLGLVVSCTSISVPALSESKRILYPHLSRCLSIWPCFILESNVGDFLPLPGNLCRLTEFACFSDKLDQSYIGSSGRAPPPIFAEPETVSLRNSSLERHSSLNSIHVQDLADVRLMWMCDPWPNFPLPFTHHPHRYGVHPLWPRATSLYTP